MDRFLTIYKPNFYDDYIKKKSIIKEYNDKGILTGMMEILKVLSSNFIPRCIMSNAELREIYLHGYENCLGEILLVFDEKNFSTVKKIIKDFSIKHFHLNYTNVLELNNIRYIVFRDSNSNIAVLQEMYEIRREILIFDLISYKVIGSMKISYLLKMFYDNIMIFYQDEDDMNRNFLFYKTELKRNNYLLSDIPSKYICKFNEYLKPAHLFKNPFLLPCGNSICWDCIHLNLNPYREKLKCNFENCRKDHDLTDLDKNLLQRNENLINSMNKYNKKIFKVIMKNGKHILNNLGNYYFN